MKNLIAILFCLITIPAFAKDIIINSLPAGAEVWVKTLNGQNFQKIGETPFKMPMDDLINNYVKEKVFMLELRKESHNPYRLLLGEFTQSDLLIDIKLQLKDELEMMEKIDSIGQSLFEMQRLIRNKNYDEALNLINEQIKTYPRLSILHELKGSVFYLNHKNVEALNSYDEAFKFNPKNLDALKMKEYLEKVITDGTSK